MTQYKVNVPATTEQDSYWTIVTDSLRQSKRQDALTRYNIERDHDEQSPLTEMPIGTTYTPIK
jgi:hypothetical protein